MHWKIFIPLVICLALLFGGTVYWLKAHPFPLTEVERAMVVSCDKSGQRLFRRISTARGVLIKQYTCIDAHAVPNYERISR